MSAGRVVCGGRTPFRWPWPRVHHTMILRGTYRREVRTVSNHGAVKALLELDRRIILKVRAHGSRCRYTSKERDRAGRHRFGRWLMPGEVQSHMNHHIASNHLEVTLL
jgi:hypothetical protein